MPERTSDANGSDLTEGCSCRVVLGSTEEAVVVTIAEELAVAEEWTDADGVAGTAVWAATDTGAAGLPAAGCPEEAEADATAEELTRADGLAETGIGVTKAGVNATSIGSNVVGRPGSVGATGTSACVCAGVCEEGNSSSVVFFFSEEEEACTGSVSIVFEFSVAFVLVPSGAAFAFGGVLETKLRCASSVANSVLRASVPGGPVAVLPGVVAPGAVPVGTGSDAGLTMISGGIRASYL